MNTVGAITVAVIGSQALFSFVQFLIIRHDSKRSAADTAILAILRDRLLHLCNKFLEAGAIDIYEEESFSKLYEAYTNLGGNSFIKELRDKVVNLPRK